MTPEAFTHLIQAIAPGAVAKAVLDTVQFRVGGRTFVTLHWPERDWAVLLLPVLEQRKALARSDAFCREPGRRRAGVTRVRLKVVDEATMAEVLAIAWREAYRGSDGDRGSKPAAGQVTRAG